MRPNYTTSCYKAKVNPVEETKPARTGQLDEDVAIYADSFIENALAANYAGVTGSSSPTKQQVQAEHEFYFKQIQSSLNLYSSLGYGQQTSKLDLRSCLIRPSGNSTYPRPSDVTISWK